MPDSPYLGITPVTPNQTGKETTINNGILALEAALNATLAVSMAGGDVTLSVAQFTRNFIFKTTGLTAARVLNVPAMVNGVNSSRLISVINPSTFDVTVQITGGAGANVVVPAGASFLLAADGNGNIILVQSTLDSLSFLAMTDTPANYTGSAKKVLRVKNDLSGIEFVVLQTSDLGDIDLTTPPADGQALVWNAIAGKFKPGTVAGGGGGSGGTHYPTWGASPGDYIQTFDTVAVADLDYLTWGPSGPGTIINDTDTTGGTAKALQFPAHVGGANHYFQWTATADATHTTLRIRYHLESEASFDYFRVFVDGVQVFQQAGIFGWQEYTTTLSVGTHTIKCAYQTDGGGQAGFANVHFGTIQSPRLISGTVYVHGDTVTHNGKTWLCIQAGTNEEPSNTASDWKEVGANSTAVGSGGSGSVPAQFMFAPPAATSFPTLVKAAGTVDPRFAIGASGGALVLGYNENITTTGDKWKLRLKTAPAGKEIIGCIDSLYPESNYGGGGLIVRNSANGKFHSFGYFFDSAEGVPTLRVMNWTNETTWLGNATDKRGSHPKRWFRIAWDATNVSFYVSADAVDWLRVAQVTLASHVGAIDQVGFGIANNYQSGGTALNNTESAANRPEVAALAVNYYKDTDIVPSVTGFSGGSSTERTPVKPLAANFTLENAGTATMTDGTYGLVLNSPAATSNIRFIRQTAALPATPWTMIIKTRTISPRRTNTRYQGCIILRNSSNGRLVVLGNYTATQFLCQRWSSYTTYSADSLAPVEGRLSEWLKVQNDGTTLTFSTSPNGVDWYAFHTETVATYLTAAGGTLDQVGFGNMISGSIPSVDLFESYELINA